jgi:Flp pilus assembly protein TadG
MRRFLRAFRRASEGDGGASAVEFALLFPIFMTLALGTLAAGVAFNRQLNVTQAVRETSRYGSTYDIATAGGIDAWLTALEAVAKQTAGAANSPVAGYDYICVAYVVITDTASPNVDNTKSKYRQLGRSPATGAGACPTAAPALIRNAAYVQVAMSKNSGFFILFANPTVQLDGLSFSPYEGKRI